MVATVKHNRSWLITLSLVQNRKPLHLHNQRLSFYFIYNEKNLKSILHLGSKAHQANRVHLWPFGRKNSSLSRFLKKNVKTEGKLKQAYSRRTEVRPGEGKIYSDPALAPVPSIKEPAFKCIRFFFIFWSICQSKI